MANLLLWILPVYFNRQWFYICVWSAKNDIFSVAYTRLLGSDIWVIRLILYRLQGNTVLYEVPILLHTEIATTEFLRTSHVYVSLVSSGRGVNYFHFRRTSGLTRVYSRCVQHVPYATLKKIDNEPFTTMTFRKRHRRSPYWQKTGVQGQHNEHLVEKCKAFIRKQIQRWWNDTTHYFFVAFH